MLAWVKRQFTTMVYVQLWQERLRVVDVTTGNEYDQRPYICLVRSAAQSSAAATKKVSVPTKINIYAIGNAAYQRSGDARFNTSNPFLHPRLLVKNFCLAEKVLQHAIQQVCRRRFMCASPVVIIQPMEKLEGGVTDVEARLYSELALGAGARVVHLHVGDELNTQNFDLASVQAPHLG